MSINFEITKKLKLLPLSFLVIVLLSGCSTKKNTFLARSYHSINTKYNIHFNANEAYKQALDTKMKSREEDFSDFLYIFPDNSDTSNVISSESFTTTIDKCTKAIKLHSIKRRPERDPKKMKDPKYQAWIKQQEFTPFMDQVWMLLAKSEFENGNYLKATSTFMYISKIYATNPEIVAECKLWVARSYTEMGWLYEAGDVLHKLEIGGIPEKNKGLYAAVKANYLTRNKEYSSAIPYLKSAIEKEKNSTEKIRMKYLLGQLYAELGDSKNASESFAKVKGLNTSYKYSFNAQLQKLSLSNDNRTEAINKLKKMSKSSKNKDYLDQIFYTIGNHYFAEKDTLNAIKNYKFAIEKSTRNGIEKALSQMALADLHFDQRKYVDAQPLYSDALGQLKKSNPNYQRVSHRSEVLDRLVTHVKVYIEQDSLQHLAQLSPEERLEIVYKKIEEVKKEEEKKRKEGEKLKKEEERSDRISSWADLERESMLGSPPGGSVPSTPGGGLSSIATNNSKFYFYNKQVVQQGKIAFQQKWGNRKLEDDWRRRNKQGTSEDTFFEEGKELLSDIDIEKEDDDNEKTGGDGKNDTDIYSPEYYLKQIPLSEKALVESNELLENALFNMGNIYKDKLVNYELATETYLEDIDRYPETKNLEEIYHQLLLIHMQLNDKEQMSIYRNKILAEFPNGKYATPLKDANYEWNFKHFASLQDSIYTQTYEAYVAGNVDQVRKNVENINKKYPFGNLMPKFALLNSLTYAQTHDAKNLESTLKEISEKYPKSDVIPLVEDILSHIKEGKVLLSDGSPIKSLDWSTAFEKGSEAEGKEKILAYNDSTDGEFILLLIYPTNKVDRNELLYKVADYNFSNYIVHTYDLAFESTKFIETLEVKGFKTFENIQSYINKGFEKNGFLNNLDTSIIVVPMSVANYTEAYPKLGLEAYTSFFGKTYLPKFPVMKNYWINKNVEIYNDETLAENIEKTAQKETEELPKEITSIEEPTIEIKAPTNKDKTDDKSEEKREITVDDFLTESQLDKLGQANNIVDDIENIMNNPVDGIKGLITKIKDRPKLSKEEKEALKEEEKLIKERKEKEKNRMKFIQDSIAKAEKHRTDSILNIEKLAQEKLMDMKKEKEETTKAIVKAKEDERKERERQRNEKVKQQNELRKKRENDRKEKLKIQENDRKAKLKAAEEKRKLLERKRSNK